MTPAQLATLRADILADPILAATDNNADGADVVIRAYNAPASPDFMVWNPRVQVSAILDTFNLAAFTPTDLIGELDIDPAVSRRIGRLLMIQVKQMNLQLMLQGRDVLDCTLSNVRASLRDALTQVPAGLAGASVSVAGGNAATALGACLRLATRGEKLFASGSSTTGATTGNLMTFVGQISVRNVLDARVN